uniref:Putative numod4 NHn endonuclease n=1 Tax=Borely moumouvirus TaxID=2712067 RepID=A0A6G6ADA0_9VIRU
MGKNKKKEIDNEEEILIIEDVVYLPLKGRGKKEGVYAMISLDKFSIVNKYKWYLGKSGYPVCYELGKMQLHRLIFTCIVGDKIPSDIYVDHIDRNKLNNTNNNLRLVTPQQNSFNKSTETNFKGVRKISENNYTSSIVKNGKKHEIKNIPTREKAAEIYNLMAEELFGEFAAFNKIY